MQLWSRNFALEKTMHDALPSQDVFHLSLSIHRSPWIMLPPYCPSSSFAKTWAQKPATGDTICKL